MSSEFPDGLIVGCYDLHLYCSNGSGHRGEFTGHNQRDAEQNARQVGWKLRPKVICPSCVKETT